MQASNHFCFLYHSLAYLSPIDFCTSDLDEASFRFCIEGPRCDECLLSDVRHYHIAATVSYWSGKWELEEVQSSPMALHVEQTYVVAA